MHLQHHMQHIRHPNTQRPIQIDVQAIQMLNWIINMKDVLDTQQRQIKHHHRYQIMGVTNQNQNQDLIMAMIFR